MNAVQLAAIFTLRVLRLEPVHHAATPSRAPVDQWHNLPAEVLLHPQFVHFHVVYSAWQRTTQTLRWAGWNGGSGSTELLVQGACVFCLWTHHFLTTPLPTWWSLLQPWAKIGTPRPKRVPWLFIYMRRSEVRGTLGNLTCNQNLTNNWCRCWK